MSCTFWLLRNFYAGQAHHANYHLKHSLKNHFEHCAHCLYKICSVFKLLEISVCLAHLSFYEISTPVMRTMLTMVKFVKSSLPTLRTLCISDLQCFETFRNSCLFCTFRLSENFYSGDAHLANYSKHILKNHSQHCAHCVYQIYSVLKLFEIAVCFVYFAFYEISTPVMPTLPTIAKIV